MRVVFMGTPDFAASILIELKEQHDVVAVYTRADAVRGRGSKLVPSSGEGSRSWREHSGVRTPARFAMKLKSNAFAPSTPTLFASPRTA